MEITRAVRAVGVAADWCARVDLDAVDATTMRNELKSLKQSMSRLEGQLARITHAADRAGAFIGTGARDTAEWLGKETGSSTRKNRTSADLGEAMANSDELAEAVCSGAVSTDKASAAVGATGGQPIDATLIETIIDLPLAGVRPAAEEWRARNDAASEQDRAAAQRSRRYLKLTGQADGMTKVDGLLDPESAAIVRTTLDAVMNESAFDNSGRRRDQRCADALTQLAKAASKGTIAGGRSNAKLLVTVPFETITERASARGRTHAGPTLDADTVRSIACDAGIHRVITGPRSSILDFGHENRLVSENLFLSLVARDRHCRWPGCSIRATWCDAHHVTEWGRHGRTDEGTCALLCSYHHSVTHQPGWTITGNAHEFTIHHPDGSTEISRPPAISTVDGSRRGRPPDGSPIRADPIGRESLTVPACSPEQLVLA